MASPMITNPVTHSTRSPRQIITKNKKKIIQAAATARAESTQWKSESQHRAYSTKLLQALRGSTGSRVDSVGPRAVREAADRALAAAARGRTRWSRAILQTRLKTKLAKRVGSTRPKRPRLSVLRLRPKNVPVIQRKVRVLGRLVPGCRKEAVPVVLEEAADYIAALQMQVRAMTALSQILSGSGSGSTGSDQNN